MARQEHFGNPSTFRINLLSRRVVLGAGLSGALQAAGGRPLLEGRQIRVRIREDFGLVVEKQAGLLWWTSEKRPPQFVLVGGRPLEFRAAARVRYRRFREGNYRGSRIELSSFPGTDVAVDLILALDRDRDELLIEARQAGGRDRVRQIDHLYAIEKPVSQGGYLVLPHGCGYLIPAEMAEKFSGSGFVGYRYSLPLFGMVRGSDGFYQIVETYSDCSVEAEHLPGEVTTLDLNWAASLGELRYPRRFLWHFAEGMDYVGMAKAYRRRAREQGLLRTLDEKAKELPAIRKYVRGFEYRAVAWSGEQRKAVLEDLRRWQEQGLRVNLFFPKWASQGFPEEAGYAADAGWQGFLREEPVREGWTGLAQFAEQARSQGCVIKVMINPNMNVEGCPGYDPARAPVDETGKPLRFPKLSPRFGPEATRRALDNVQSKGLRFDALYFDGYSAYSGHGEDHSPAHPVTRRQGFESQVESFRETRRHGIIPGAELPRFWCVGECAFFFFDNGWSSDRLPVGEPVPLFQLVFRDCYSACFSGGGYGRYDWPAEKNPRLYELLLGAAPGYNWMLPYGDAFPGLGLQGGVPIRNWGEDRMQARIEWLRRWSAWYQAIAYSEMVSHEFLQPDRRVQRIRFANGVTADFDMPRGLCRVSGVAGFSGGWEPPHEGLL
ncbi:MAG TPA: hypothetical protein VM120_16110 [Bryobacteraceae bacterium]|nr:hypothetical protein [Bryobacteraceae bacterium]